MVMVIRPRFLRPALDAVGVVDLASPRRLRDWSAEAGYRMDEWERLGVAGCGQILPCVIVATDAALAKALNSIQNILSYVVERGHDCRAHDPLALKNFKKSRELGFR